MTVLMASTEVQQNFGRVIDHAVRETDVVVERYGEPRVVIVDYRRYQRLIESEQQLLRSRLQQASRAITARAAGMAENEIDALIERARADVATPSRRKTSRKRHATRRR